VARRVVDPRRPRDTLDVMRSLIRYGPVALCALEVGCGDRDCNQWYTYPIASDIEGAVVSDRTFFYGRGGLLLLLEEGAFWPPDRWNTTSTRTTEDLHGGSATGPTMMLVGNAGTIRYSLDYAETWLIPETPGLSAALYAVDTDCSTGTGAIAVGEAGTIVRTEDAVHWSLVPPPGGATLRDVAFVEPMAIAVGDGGTVLISDDRGLAWRSLDLGTDEDFLAIDFPRCFDGRRPAGSGLLMTAAGTFFASTDGGRTWLRQHPDAPGAPRSMFVFDRGTARDENFAGLDVEVAIGDQLWVIHSPELGEAERAEGWVLVEEFAAPIRAVFDRSSVLTPGEAHYYRDGFRCSAL
jgi:hypothetical protein